MKYNSKSNNLYTVYRSVILNCKSEIESSLSKDQQVELGSFLSPLLSICSFVLHDRFQPTKKKSRSKGKKGKGVKSHDLALFLASEQPKKEKKRELSLLDVITAFKLLENYILKRKYKSN